MKNENQAVSAIIKAASAKKDGLGELQRELTRRGVDCSYTQLSNALKGITKSLENEVLFECMDIASDNDWNKLRKLLKRP